MSLGDWTAWNNRTSRPREEMRELDSTPEPEPMEVEESDPGQTWIGKMFRWPKGTP